MALNENQTAVTHAQNSPTGGLSTVSSSGMVVHSSRPFKLSSSLVVFKKTHMYTLYKRSKAGDAAAIMHMAAAQQFLAIIVLAATHTAGCARTKRPRALRHTGT